MFLKDLILSFHCDRNATQQSHNILKSLILLGFAAISACSTMTINSAVSIWNDTEFTQKSYITDNFTLMSWQKITQPGADTVIYIEGDGHAWITRHQIATDPTPVLPLVQEWAIRDPRPNVIYLARPCQFIATFEPPCQKDYWTNKRFAPEIINSTNQAIDQIKQQTGTAHFILVGYSGGGAVATLVTRNRQDISLLVTVAGNLDTILHSQIHQVSPLTGSLNPYDSAPFMGHIKQRHYIGGNDTNITGAITRHYISHLPAGSDVDIITIPGATHNSGWDHIDFSAIQ